MSDSLDSLKAALAPKTGMRRIPIPLESYEHPSGPLSSKKLINMLAEKAPSDARTAAALVPAHGLAPFMTLPTPGVVAINAAMAGSVYVVAGTHLYRLSFPPRPNPGIEDLGALDLSGMRNYDFITIAVSPTAAVVCVPPHAYTCGHNPTGTIGGDPMNIVGGTFPAEGAATVAYLDGYFVFSNFADNAQWFISALWDPSTYDALDFATADAVPNVLRLIAARSGQLWLFGENGIEVWYDAGNQDFPFRRVPGAVMVPGPIDALCVCQIDNSFWFVGKDGVVYRTKGYNLVRVSTHPIEELIRAQWPNQVFGFAYQWRGHSFYVITQVQRTFIYDCATEVWHERSSAADGSTAWFIRSSALFSGGAWLLGDFNTGALYTPASFEPDDASLRQVTLPPLWAGTKRAFCSRLEVEMEVGTTASHGDVLLEWSDDGGTTWTGSRVMSAGAVGELRRRVVATRLGSFRQRVFRISTHSPSTIFGVDADIQAGVS